MPREKTFLQKIGEGFIAPVGGFAAGKTVGKVLRHTDAATANLAAAATGLVGFVGACITAPDSAMGQLSRTALTSSSATLGMLSEVEAAGGTVEQAERAKADDQAESERERGSAAPPAGTDNTRQDQPAQVQAQADTVS